MDHAGAMMGWTNLKSRIALSLNSCGELSVSFR
jgi:hypothetical protein